MARELLLRALEARRRERACKTERQPKGVPQERSVSIQREYGRRWADGTLKKEKKGRKEKKQRLKKEKKERSELFGEEMSAAPWRRRRRRSRSRR